MGNGERRDGGTINQREHGDLHTVEVSRVTSPRCISGTASHDTCVKGHSSPRSESPRAPLWLMSGVAIIYQLICSGSGKVSAT